VSLTVNVVLNEGDSVEVRGREYIVTDVVTPAHVDGVLDYELDPVDDDAPPARLEPSENDGEVVLAESHAVAQDDVEVLEDDNSEVTQR